MSLLIYWTNLYLALNTKAKTTNYQNISLKDYLFWGKTVIHSTIHSTHTFEKVRNYKNFIISFNHIKLHLILTRPQKVIQAGNIIEQGRGFFPLYCKNIFSLQILESLHDPYYRRDVIYPINKTFSEQLFHPHMKIKFTAYNKKCPNSCLQRAVTLDERYKMYSPGGLGDLFNFLL